MYIDIDEEMNLLCYKGFFCALLNQAGKLLSCWKLQVFAKIW